MVTGFVKKKIQLLWELVMRTIEQEYRIITLKYHKGKIVSDFIYEKGFKTITPEKFSCFVSVHNNQSKCDVDSYELLKDLHSMEKRFIQLDEILSKINKSLLVYIKDRAEHINTQKESDQRYYRFVRVVIRDLYELNTMEEIYPQYLDTDTVITFVEEIVQREVNKVYLDEKNNFEAYDEKVMLSPQAAGFFIHETIGHLLEEDIYQYFEKQLQSIKFPKEFLLSDDPTGYETIVGINKIDDYGQKVAPLILIKNRKIINHIQIDKGFARSESIDHKPLARMRMLTLDSIQGHKMNTDGTSIFIKKIHSGQVIPANFTFMLKGEGIFINSLGEESRLANVLLSGNLKEAMESIFFIGSEQEVLSADCTKSGQTIRVGSRSPSIGFISGKVVTQ